MVSFNAVNRTLLRRGATLLSATLIAVGLWHGASAVWLYAKAALAQQLIAQAWRDQLRSGSAARPWPWADTHPVARLSWSRGGIDLIVLEGMRGEALAFGPGLIRSDGTASTRPGNAALVIAGHRDTHFRFLADLQIGDELQLQQRGGTQRYRVEMLRIVDSSREALQVDDGELVLVTCYPFDAVRAGGPLRYRVSARPLPFTTVANPDVQPIPEEFSL